MGIEIVGRQVSAVLFEDFVCLIHIGDVSSVAWFPGVREIKPIHNFPHRQVHILSFIFRCV